MAFPIPRAPAVTSARIDLRYGVLYRTWLPLILVQLPPPTEDRWPIPDPTMQHLRDVGWAHPGALFHGSHISAVAHATVDGAMDDGPVSIAGGGIMLYQGPLHRSPAWREAVRSAGTVAVLVTTLTDDLSPAARDGEVLGAHGILFHRSPTITAEPVLPEPRTGD